MYSFLQYYPIRKRYSNHGKLKALAKDDAKKELERKMLDAKKKARVIANRKAYLKRQKAKKEKAEKEKAEKAQREKEQEEMRKKLAQ